MFITQYCLIASDPVCLSFDDEAYPPIVSLVDFDSYYFEVISTSQSLP
jgi:hypothetical protein